MRLVIDTDIGNDCDDAGAIALMHNLRKEYDFDVLAIGSSTPYIEGAHTIELINSYYNYEVPIGQNNAINNDRKELYTVKLSNSCNVDKNKQFESYVKTFRKAFVTTDEKIELIILGPFNMINEFLNSESDEISPLTGVELINLKASHIYIMGGTFANPPKYFANSYITSEWNIKCDIKSVQNFINKIKVEMTFIPFETGLFLTGKNLIKDLNNPVYKCYEIYSNGIRESWDLVTMYYAISKDESLFIKSNKGFVIVDDNGVTTFKECENGRHTYLLNKNEESTKEVIDKYLY